MKAKSIIHVAAAFLIFKLTDGFSNVAFRLSVSDITAEIVYVFLAVFSIFVSVRLYTAYIMKQPPGELGLAGPWPDKVWCIVAAALPAAVIFFYLLFMDGEMQRQELPLREAAYAVCLSLLSAGLCSAVRVEIIFRGMILGALRKSWGTKTAVLASSFLFALPCFVDTVYSWQERLTAALAVFIIGLSLSLVTAEAGSIWPAALILGIYNAFVGNSHLLHIGTEHNFSALWTYTLSGGSRLLTGNENTIGLTAALPAITGFAAAGMLALWRMRQKAPIKNKNMWRRALPAAESGGQGSPKEKYEENTSGKGNT